MLLDSFLPSRTLSSMKICKRICRYVANRSSRKLCGGSAAAGRLCKVRCFPWRPISVCSWRRGSVRIFVWRKQLPAGNRSESLPVIGVAIRSYKKGSSSHSTPRYSWWSWRGSNSRPLECHSSALPAELQPHTFGFR